MEAPPQTVIVMSVRDEDVVRTFVRVAIAVAAWREADHAPRERAGT
ncbi:MAG: hypothetical protein WD766_06335 [Gemmatimonadota bacterium]